MRAWQVNDLGEPRDVMSLEVIDDPTPEPDEIVLEVQACGLKFPDRLQIQGGYQVKPPLPFIPGGEMAGTVVALGSDVSGIAVGDRVLSMGMGGLAELTTAKADQCFPIPDDMSFNQAACLLTNYGTTVFALENRARLAAGETMLVTAAAGGVGSAAIQVGKALGARVLGLAGGPEKVKTVLDLGADDAFDYKEVDIVETVRAATDKQGVDVCYEAVGGDTFDQVRRCMAWDGRLLVIGFTSGRIPDAPANHILLKNYAVMGVHWGAWLGRNPDGLRENWARIVELFGTGHIDPLIHSVRPLSEAVTALEDIGARKTVGKVVIAVGGDES